MRFDATTNLRISDHLQMFIPSIDPLWSHFLSLFTIVYILCNFITGLSIYISLPDLLFVCLRWFCWIYLLYITSNPYPFEIFNNFRIKNNISCTVCRCIYNIYIIFIHLDTKLLIPRIGTYIINVFFILQLVH